MKSVIKICMGSFVIIGTVIGAGFASGREILVFFARDVKFIGILFLALLACFFALTYYFMSVGKNRKINCLKDLIVVGNDKFKNVASGILAMTYLISTASMLAGMDEIGKSAIALNIPLLSIFSFLVATLFVVKGVGGLKLANSILVPSILAFIVGISIFHLQGKLNIVFENQNSIAVTVANAIAYALMNVLLASIVMAKIGEEMTKPQIKITALISSAVIAVVVAMFLLAMSNGQDLSRVPMPIMALAKQISSGFSAVSSVVIYFGIFTTLIASYYSLYEYVQSYLKSKIASVIVCFCLSFSLSRLGFAKIVAIFYPIESLLALFLLLCSAKKGDYLYLMTRRSNNDTK